MLCEDLAHATEQLNMLTEASKKHSGLLQSAQEELTRKEALIRELQHEVRQTRGCVSQDRPGEGDCSVLYKQTRVLTGTRQPGSCSVGSSCLITLVGSHLRGCFPTLDP